MCVDRDPAESCCSFFETLEEDNLETNTNCKHLSPNISTKQVDPTLGAHGQDFRHLGSRYWAAEKELCSSYYIGQTYQLL